MNLDQEDIKVLVDFFTTLAEIEQVIIDSGDPDGILSENGWQREDT